MRIIDTTIDELLTHVNGMQWTFIDIIDTIDEKTDIKTKMTIVIDTLTRVYIILYMSIMSIICQWHTILHVNNLSITCQYVNNTEVN